MQGKTNNISLLSIQVEQLKAGRIAYLMSMIDSVRSFTGEAHKLEPFITRMDAVKELLSDQAMDATTNVNLHYLFVARIAEPLMLKLGIRFSMTWEDIKKVLRERFMGARRPLPRDTLRITRLCRGQRETPADFAIRIGGEFRTLARKVEDTCTDSEEGKWRETTYEEIFVELLALEMPERVRDKLRLSRHGTLEAAVAFVGDLEVEQEDARREDGEGWSRVESRRPKPPPVREWRPASPVREWRPAPPRHGRPQSSRDRPQEPRNRQEYRSSPRPVNRRQEDPGRGRRRQPSRPGGDCWECGTPGHFARECPWIFRRATHPFRSYAKVARGDEAMEVNACEVPERRSSGSCLGCRNSREEEFFYGRLDQGPREGELTPEVKLESDVDAGGSDAEPTGKTRDGKEQNEGQI
jgi:hypothetical protein